METNEVKAAQVFLVGNR